MKKLAVLFFILSFSFLYLHNISEAKTPKGPVKVSLLMAFTPNVGFSPFYVAKTKGFYAQQGLDLEILHSSEGVGAVLKQLGAGNVEFGYGGDAGAIRAAEKGVPVVAVQCIIPKNLFQIMTRKNSGIRTLSDLKGRSLGCEGPTGLITQISRIMLYESGISFSQIEPRYTGSQLIGSFVKGQVDAFAGHLPHQVIAEQILKESLTVFPAHEKTTLGTTYVYTSKKLADHSPDIVKKFIRATQKGLDYSVQNPEEAVEAFITILPVANQKKQMHLSIWKAFVKKAFERNEKGNIIYKQPGLNEWNYKMEQMVKANIISKPVSLNGYVSNNFLP